jgi:hypothetical protein
MESSNEVHLPRTKALRFQQPADRCSPSPAQLSARLTEPTLRGARRNMVIFLVASVTKES